MRKAIIKVRAKHPNSIMIYQHQHVANPVNLYKRLKASGILHFKGNYCEPKVQEIELINKCGELCFEK
jgi:hypothetical protein